MSQSRDPNPPRALTKVRKMIVAAWVVFGVALLSFAVLETVVSKVVLLRQLQVLQGRMSAVAKSGVYPSTDWLREYFGELSKLTDRSCPRTWCRSSAVAGSLAKRAPQWAP